MRSYTKRNFSSLKFGTHKNKISKDLEDNLWEIYTSIMCVCIGVQTILISRNPYHDPIKENTKHYIKY